MMRDPQQQAPPMDDATLERYADWLDELERSDPEGYKRLVATMQQQVQAAGLGAGGADADASLLDMLRQTAAPPEADFAPKLPGGRVMEADGIKAKAEGVHIDVEPGFVIKTYEIKSKKKVFVNVCFSDAVQSFSEKKQLDEKGNEQEGIHVPLSLGAAHDVTDKKGERSLAFDVAVNTKVVEDCKQDKTGAFRNFVCELALEYIDQKYKIQLDGRYKLPRLTYAGELPPPRHYIRKVQAPIIQEVVPGTRPTKPKAATTKTTKTPVEKTATARLELLEEWISVSGDVEKQIPCKRTASVESNSPAISPAILQNAGTHLTVKVVFERPIASSEDIQLKLRPEHFAVQATGHRDLSTFLPYPVKVEQTSVTLDRATNSLLVTAVIDKLWDELNPDAGSNPWLLAQALDDDSSDDHKENPRAASIESSSKSTMQSEQTPKSLAEMFHLSTPDTTSVAATQNEATPMQRAARWDPVGEDEELPEDRFHRKDMMSMHILEQRRQEREQKAKEAEEKRKEKRAQVEEMQRKAREAGKTWREMYPNEPETTYIDVEDIVKQEKERLAQQQQEPSLTDIPKMNAESKYVPTEVAKRAAAAWSENLNADGFTLKSAMAFELL